MTLEGQTILREPEFCANAVISAHFPLQCHLPAGPLCSPGQGDPLGSPRLEAVTELGRGRGRLYRGAGVKGEGGENEALTSPPPLTHLHPPGPRAPPYGESGLCWGGVYMGHPSSPRPVR